MAQNNRKIMDEIKETLGMGFIERSRNGNGELTVFSWYIGDRQSYREFIALMKERIILKKKQLNLFEEFINLKPNRKAWCRHPELLLKALRLALEISELNNGTREETIPRLNSYIRYVETEVHATQPARGRR